MSSRRGEAGRRRNHILLGNAELYEALGVAPREADKAVRILQIGAARDNGMPFLGKGDQRVGQCRESRRAAVQFAILPRTWVEGPVHRAAPAMISSIARASSAGAR